MFAKLIHALPIEVKNLKLISLVASSAFLIACGGSGGSDSRTSAAEETFPASSPEALPESVPEPLPEQITLSEVTSTGQLVVPNEFAFLDNDSLWLTVESNEDVYLSVCAQDTSDERPGTRINYDNCYLRTWVRTDEFNSEINLPPHVDRLNAAVLSPTNLDMTQHYEWTREEGLNWRIRL